MPDEGPAASLARDRRIDWARPRSGHDRSVGMARVALPSAVGALAALLAMTPLAHREEMSFVLAKDRVAMAHERMRVARAQYRGQDDKGQAFTLNAGSALQASSKNPVVQLGDLSGRLDLSNGPATLVAPAARYDMDAAKLQVDGLLTVTGADGYRLTTRNVAADLNTRTLSSNTAVAGQMPLGSFTAGNMRADLASHTVSLGGRVHLHIVQGGARARR